MSFEELLTKIVKKQKVAKKHNDELKALIDLRNDLCQHTSTTRHERYNGGGYDYTDYTEYWSVCDCCGQRSDTVRVDHGSYA